MSVSMRWVNYLLISVIVFACSENASTPNYDSIESHKEICFGNDDSLSYDGKIHVGDEQGWGEKEYLKEFEEFIENEDTCGLYERIKMMEAIADTVPYVTYYAEKDSLYYEIFKKCIQDKSLK